MSPYYHELCAVHAFYDGRRASRSGELLTEHIISGIALLYDMGASDKARQAFCLHPIVQTGADVDVSWSDSFELACEYRDKANAYLCRPHNDYIKTVDDVFTAVGCMSDDCADMLRADKLQNRISFNHHHKGKHERSEQLAKYFDLWIEYLNSNKWRIVREEIEGAAK